jgi:hypothetical protein
MSLIIARRYRTSVKNVFQGSRGPKITGAERILVFFIESGVVSLIVTVGSAKPVAVDAD